MTWQYSQTAAGIRTLLKEHWFYCSNSHCRYPHVPFDGGELQTYCLSRSTEGPHARTRCVCGVPRKQTCTVLIQCTEEMPWG
ncbi:unnamed protein product [Ixodes pacificus]